MDFGVGFLSNNIMLPFLDFFYGIVPNYGLAIIALTLVVRFALFPVSANQLRSMRRMKIANPVMQQRIKEVQERYKSDPKKQQEEMAKVNAENFKEFGNPLSGCLPALLQLPILFALFATLRGSPFADINYTLNFQIQPQEQQQQIQHQAFSTPTQNVYFADKVHYPVQAAVAAGTNLAVGEHAKINLQTVSGQAFDSLNDEYKEVNLAPRWKITKGEGLAEIAPDGTLNALQTGDVTLQVTVPGLAADKGFLFIQALGKVGATNPDGSINWDIVIMVLGFGLSLYINQALSSGSTPQAKNSDTSQQDTMNKLTPIIFSGMFLFFPLPSGVMLYMLVANIFQTAQAFLVAQEPLPENLQKLVEATSPAKPAAKAESKPAAKADAKAEPKPTASKSEPKAITPSKTQPSQIPFKAKEAPKKVEKNDTNEQKGTSKNSLPFEPGSSKKKKKP